MKRDVSLSRTGLMYIIVFYLRISVSSGQIRPTYFPVGFEKGISFFLLLYKRFFSLRRWEGQRLKTKIGHKKCLPFFGLKTFSLFLCTRSSLLDRVQFFVSFHLIFLKTKKKKLLFGFYCGMERTCSTKSPSKHPASSLALFSFFHFIRRFWNQILIWRSVRQRAWAISIRLRLVK